VTEKPTIIKLKVHHAISYVNHLVTVLLGKTLKIICQATGIPKPIIDWKREGNTLVSGERTVLNGEQLVTHQVKENDSGVYTCVASNVIGNDELSSTVDVWGMYLSLY
jgi:hypothetical protein